MALTTRLHTLPFDPPTANALRAEYLAMPWRRRLQACRKVGFRLIGMRLSGQARLQREQVPEGTRRVLLVYSWTTLGDALMDLSARHLVPAGIRLDLCIAPHLAALFEGDAAFTSVVTRLDDDCVAPDFILLDCLSSALLHDKTRHFPEVPFASLRGHLIGERFDRTSFADRRMRQLFGLPPGPVAPATLRIDGPAATAIRTGRFRLAVALGARRDDRRYPHWAAVLASLIAQWPVDRPPPECWLLGSDNGVDELALFDAAFLREHCVVKVGTGSLRDTAVWLRDCDAFVGADGGLMHLAVALGRPVVALFSRDVEPAWRLPGDVVETALQSSTVCVRDVAPRRVVEAVLGVVRGARRACEPPPDLHGGHAPPIGV